MTCYNPLQGYLSNELTKNGKRKLVFSPSNAFSTDKLFQRTVPCGQCIGCRLEYSRQWAIRCMHESSLYDDNCFITLTYNDEFLPKHRGLEYRDFTLFMKRLRKRFGSGIRYYMAGEYGELNRRPHYHALLFNFDFNDKVLFKKTHDMPLFTSETLDSFWTCPVTKRSYGFASVGSCTFESAAYVARYMMKKVKGEDTTLRYFNVDISTGECVPLDSERALMSRRPGIASDWYDKYSHQVIDKDYVIVNGKKVKPPKYYDGLLAKVDPARLELIKEQRILDAKKYSENNSFERLQVRKKVKEADLGQLVRTL